MAKTSFTVNENDGPMKKLANVIPAGIFFNNTANPAILLDYGKHEMGIILHEDSEYENPCNLKQGFMALIEKIDQGNASFPSIFHVRPVFTVLNKNSLSFFEGEHVTTLYKATKIVPHITTYQPRSWNVSGLFCFEIQKPNQDKNAHTNYLGVCAQNYEKMESWMEAIPKYYNCKVQEMDVVEEIEYKTGVEVRKMRRNAEEAERKKIKEMEEQSEKEEEARELDKMKAKSDLEALKDSINQIKGQMEANNQKDQKERLRLLEERKRQEELREFLHREEDCLTDTLSNKAFESEQKAENMFTQYTKVAQENILNSTTSKLGEMGDKERLVKQIESADLLRAEGEMNERLKHFLIQETIGFEMDLDSGQCYSQELAISPKKYMPRVCVNLQTPGGVPDLQALKDCTEPSNFCVFCCAHLIGEAHLDDRVACRTKCEDKRKGFKEVIKVPIVNGVDRLPSKVKILLFQNAISADIVKGYMSD